MDSLAMLVTDTLRGNPFCGDLFVFRSKRSDRVKILAWDGTGLVLYSKRLETGHFIWPAIQDGVITLSASQFFSMVWTGRRWLHALWSDRCALDKSRNFAGDSRCVLVASFA
jgi:transposase